MQLFRLAVSSPACCGKHVHDKSISCMPIYIYISNFSHSTFSHHWPSSPQKRHLTNMLTFYPKCSMYGIFTYIYHKFMVNVGTYSSPMKPPINMRFSTLFSLNKGGKKTSTYHPPRIWLNHRHPSLQNPETKQWLAGKWTGLKMVFPIENPHVSFSCWFCFRISSKLERETVENSSVTSFLTNN